MNWINSPGGLDPVVFISMKQLMSVVMSHRSSTLLTSSKNCRFFVFFFEHTKTVKKKNRATKSIHLLKLNC